MAIQMQQQELNNLARMEKITINDESKQAGGGGYEKTYDSKKKKHKKINHHMVMEVFIKNKDMVGEYLGCLMSTVDKISKCLSQDTQSDEAGNLAFDFAIPKVDSENTESHILMAKLSFKYPKVIKKQDSLSKIVELDERNEELDPQHNRSMAEEAMESGVNNQKQLQVVDQCKRENINSLTRFMHLLWHSGANRFNEVRFKEKHGK